MARLLTVVSANTPARIPNDTRLARALKWMGRTLSRAGFRRGQNLPPLRPDTIGVQEGQGIENALPLPGYRAIYTRHGEDQRRGAKDTIILTRNRWPSLGSLSLKATDTVNPERFAPERWPTVSIFEHPQGEVAHVNVHDNATIRHADRSDAKYREHLDLMRALDVILDLLEVLGVEHIVVTADANWRRRDDGPGRDIYDVLKAHRLWVWSHGVDLMAHSRSLRSVRRWRVPKRHHGGDHDWLVRQFEARGK